MYSTSLRNGRARQFPRNGSSKPLRELSRSQQYTGRMRDDVLRLAVGLLLPALLAAQQFVYLIQSSAPRTEPRLLPHENRDVLYLCFARNCNVSGVPAQDVLMNERASARRSPISRVPTVVNTRVCRFLRNASITTHHPRAQQSPAEPCRGPKWPCRALPSPAGPSKAPGRAWQGSGRVWHDLCFIPL